MRSVVAVSLALLAHAVAASPLRQIDNDNTLLGRDYPLLQERSVADTPVRIISARSNKAERDSLYKPQLELVERHIEDSQRQEGLTKRDVQQRSLHKRQLQSQPCGLGPSARSQICRDYVTNNNVDLPRDAYANCNQNTGFCQVKCRNGSQPIAKSSSLALLTYATE
ncbi:hypothetical protein OIO90_005480 [Microbotryomycetes sp. JL221]|nr:hypothetical protein OIO90_005480 [Microbotryomycetes sp. JL221]